MQQIIIMEGCDMVGKTTIAHEVSKRLGLPIFKCKRTDRWTDMMVDLKYAGEALLQIVEQTGVSLIFDRLYPSEYAYSKAYNRQTLPELISQYDERYAKLGAVIVIFYKQPHAFQEDDQHLIELEKYEAINAAFREFKDVSKCRVLMIDTTDENLEKQVTDIINFAGEQIPF